MDDMNRAELDLFLGGEDEEAQGPLALPQVDQVYEIELLADGRASAVELIADEDGELRPPPGARPREFASLEEAIAYTGRTGLRTDGALVAVVMDGQLI